LLYRKSAAKPCWQRPARISKSERETVMKCIQINITIVRQAESERSEARSVSRTIPEMKSSGTPQKKHSGAVSLNVFPKDTPTKRSGICPCSVIRIVQESFFSFLLQYSNYQLLRKCSIPLKIEV
jgi:hypothetical protein